MKAVINYILNPDKTMESLITGIGVNPDNAFNEMVTLKKLMGKTDRRLWYHFIQSFPPYDNITPELALQVAVETADYFKEQYQILIAVHTDKLHFHTHFIMNTVNIETGRKYTQNNEQRLEIQALSDKICKKYNLHVLTEEQKNRGSYKKPGEYRTEQSGQGWKAKLKATIDDVLSIAVSREDFIRKMEKGGYKVKWSDTRENITFTTPTGMKCRDRRLGEPDYYNKHNFEMIFSHNLSYAENNDEDDIMPSLEPLLKNLTGLFDHDNDSQSVIDGFMIHDVDFEGLSWIEIQEKIERLRREAEIRNTRIAAKQDEAAAKAAKRDFYQTMACLDELEKWLLESNAILNQNDEMLYEYDDHLEL